MEITTEQVISFRLRAHHLDRHYPQSELLAAAGACGLQNSPPGSWETALFNRLADCRLEALQTSLYEEKTLLQAWSFRGVPVVFPTAERAVFLRALQARPDEEPWIYTRGLDLALEYLQLTVAELLPAVMAAAAVLDTRVVTSKAALDKVLADQVRPHLPPAKQARWQAASMYDPAGRQTVGEAVVSFLLRPCSFHSLVVFGQRTGSSPTFTSMANWLGQYLTAAPPAPAAEMSAAAAERTLVGKFLHCYGPTTQAAFIRWLGCSKAQGQRLWNAAATAMSAVAVGGRKAYILTADRENLQTAAADPERLLLLGPHDPYLDLQDRALLLADPLRQRQVWRTVANPGVVLRGGQIIGIWKPKTQAGKLSVALQLWAADDPAEQHRLRQLAQEYAGFRRLSLKACTFAYS